MHRLLGRYLGSNPESVLATALYVFHILNRGQREERQLLNHFLLRVMKGSYHSSVSRFRHGFDPNSCGICGGQGGTELCFLRVLRIPLPIFIEQTVPCSSSIMRGWYNEPTSGRRAKCTPSHSSPRKYRGSKTICILKEVNKT